MLEYLSVLKKSPLFQGASEKEIKQMLPCLQARSRMVRKGDFVLRQGQPVNGLMILAKGCLHMQRDDYWGNRSILTTVNPGELFGAAYFAPENSTALHDVKAVEDSVVVCFDVKKLLSVCPSACRFHTMAVQNLYRGKTGSSCRSWIIFRSGQPGKSFFLTFRQSPPARAVRTSRFPSAGSSWRIISLWTGAPCPGSCADCRRKVFSPSTEIIFRCTDLFSAELQR